MAAPEWHIGDTDSFNSTSDPYQPSVAGASLAQSPQQCRRRMDFWHGPIIESVDDTNQQEDVDDDDEEEPHTVPRTTAELRLHNRKLKRFRLTNSQTRYLMSEFAKHQLPDAAHRERLSREIPGFSPRQVQIWFQNRRAKLKRLTSDDREHMMRSRALPADFDMRHVLRLPVTKQRHVDMAETFSMQHTSDDRLVETRNSACQTSHGDPACVPLAPLSSSSSNVAPSWNAVASPAPQSTSRMTRQPISFPKGVPPLDYESENTTEPFAGDVSNLNESKLGRNSFDTRNLSVHNYRLRRTEQVNPAQESPHQQSLGFTLSNFRQPSYQKQTQLPPGCSFAQRWNPQQQMKTASPQTMALGIQSSVTPTPQHTVREQSNYFPTPTTRKRSMSSPQDRRGGGHIPMSDLGYDLDNFGGNYQRVLQPRGYLEHQIYPFSSLP